MSDKHKYRVLKTWNNFKAEHEYVLQKIDKFGLEYENLAYRGDKDWAERQKEHYGCEIADEEQPNE